MSQQNSKSRLAVYDKKYGASKLELLRQKCRNRAIQAGDNHLQSPQQQFDTTDCMFDNKFPFLGQQFGSLQEFTNALKLYEKNTKNVFTVVDSRKLSPNTPQHIAERFVYFKRRYNCKFGKRRVSASNNLRQRSSFKVGCPAVIRFAISKDFQYLVIVEVNDDHEGHPDSESFYGVLPEVRQLSPDEKEIVLERLKLEPNVKLVHKMVHATFGKQVSLKDLHNMKSKMKRDTDKQLEEAAKLLEHEYGAECIISLDCNSQFKGLYFSTPKMRADLQARPEIVFLHRTFKLLNIGMPLIILFVEDEDGKEHVVGVSLLASKKPSVVSWFLDVFKQQNPEASLNVESFITNNDFIDSNVLECVFPNARRYICLFYTLSTFEKVVDSVTMNLKPKEKTTAKCLLKKLTYSSSVKQYDQIYNEFCETCPSQLVTYFNENWHCIYEEWTTFNMPTEKLCNSTNNQLESLRQVLPSNSSLKQMIIWFFDWYSTHQQQATVYTPKPPKIIRIKDFRRGSDEKQYVTKLKKYASDIVLEELENCKTLSITILDEAMQKCLIKEDTLTYVAYPTSCECSRWKWSHLPCKHVLAVRKHFHLPLFDESLFASRWARKTKAITDDVSGGASFVHPTPELVTKKVLSDSERQTMITSTFNKLANVLENSSDEDFDRRINNIEELINIYRKGEIAEITWKEYGEDEPPERVHTQAEFDSFVESVKDTIDISVPFSSKVRKRLKCT